MADYSEDVKSINKYITEKAKLSTTTKTAKKVADTKWRPFYEKWLANSDWWTTSIGDYSNTQENYDIARNIRNEFNRANAVTDSQKEAVERQIQTGITSEEWEADFNAVVSGKPVGTAPRRTTSTGDYLEKEDLEGEDFVPLRLKVLAGAIGVVALAAYLGLSHPLFAIPIAILKIPKKILGGK